MAHRPVYNFQRHHYHQAVQVAFWADMAVQAEVLPVLVEMQTFFWASSVSA
jgi:hypothetical protein